MKIHLINLDHRIDRYVDFIAQLNKSEIIRNNYIKISALNGQVLTNEDIRPYVTNKGYEDIVNNKLTRGLYLSRGAIALALTYKKLLEQTNENILFLEDDIIIHPNFDDIFTNTFNTIPENWDILYLGWYNSKNLKIINISNYINQLDGQINGTQGWVVNYKSISKILNIFPLNYQIDTELYRDRSIIKYSTVCPIITRNNKFKSDIQN